MENQKALFKGELMEELLRSYFLSLGYYVLRGVKLRYDNIDVTDIDLYLYGRSSSLTRERINVDIKNKKTPQAFERIVWTNGLMKILNFDSCIVATTDTRSAIHAFAKKHNTTIFDGAFLNRLRSNPTIERRSEEDFLSELSRIKSHKTFPNKDWRFVYELSKSKLLSEQDFSGFNSSLSFLIYFIEKSLVDVQKRDTAVRMTYIVFSHLLVIIDFICKDIAFLQPVDREKKLSDGFTFGNLGKDGVDKIISMAVEISGSRSANTVRKSLENIPTQILTDFLSKNDSMKNLFNWAKDFEALGFKQVLAYPDKIEAPLKGVIAVTLDFFNIDRRKYFDVFLTKDEDTISNS
jgi:hypothetical protein